VPDVLRTSSPEQWVAVYMSDNPERYYCGSDLGTPPVWPVLPIAPGSSHRFLENLHKGIIAVENASVVQGGDQSGLLR